ncbi:hypothetical protein D9M68_566550 [compost metagenome]
MRIASSCQKVSNSCSARAIFCAIGSRHRLWNSTMMSILPPTAWRILRKGSSAVSRSALLMYCPWLFSAAGSKGQIFMAVMPSDSSDSASSSAWCRKPCRSSYGPLLLARPQFELVWLVALRMYW